MVSTTTPAIDVANLLFCWPGQPDPVLDIDVLSMQAGEQVFLHGPSGSGKSTLLALLSGIMQPGRGSISIMGTDLGTLPAYRRDRFRVDHIGFIFQQFNLIPYLSILDNVLLPCHFSAARRQRLREQGLDMATAARHLLQTLDLPEALWQRDAAALSIGQQQRVAAARALIGSPPVIMADEPTSALDADRQQAFLSLLQAQCRTTGAALLFISHNLSLQQQFDRTIALHQINRVSPKESC